jgi:hypothetical protein
MKFRFNENSMFEMMLFRCGWMRGRKEALKADIGTWYVTGKRFKKQNGVALSKIIHLERRHVNKTNLISLAIGASKLERSGPVFGHNAVKARIVKRKFL